MASATVLLLDKGTYREVAVETLPLTVRAAVADITARHPAADVRVDQLGVLYRIHMSEPANRFVDVLAVA